MDAVISGRAGMALLIDGDSLMSFDVDEPETLLPRRHADLRFLFGEATDLQFIEDIDRSRAEQELERAFNENAALDLALIVLDAELPGEVRNEAAEALNDILSDSRIVERLENVLYGRPLPSDADLTGALAASASAPNLLVLLQRLEARQPAIREVCKAWDEIPPEAFGGQEEQAQFQSIAVRDGLFRQLAIECDGEAQGERLLIDSLRNPDIRKLRNHREILQLWTARFRRRSPVRTMKPDIEEPISTEDSSRRDRRGRRRRVDRESVLRKVNSQKALIIQAMRDRDLDRAAKVVDELIVFQLENGEPIHAVKSLCDLATEAKVLGIFQLQLKLTEQSIAILPDDAWSWTQYADALSKANRLNESLSAYDQAGAFGADVVVKSGRADTLKVLGRLPEALSAYEETIAAYPEDVFAKNGRAEVLKALGRLPEALSAYEAIVVAYPEDVVARNSRSCILAALRRYDEALEHLPDNNLVTLNDWIGYHIRGMILLRMSKWEEAMQVFERGVKDNPQPSSREYFKAALAIALLRRRDFNEASRLLDEVTEPLLQPQADVLRVHSFGALGEMERATTAYQKLEAKPWSISDELISELHRRYILKEEPRHDDEWLFDQETSSLLLIASQQSATSFSYQWAA